MNRIASGYVQARVHVAPVAYATQVATLLAQSTESLHETIQQFVLTNPLVEFHPQHNRYQPDLLIASTKSDQPSLPESLWQQYYLIEDDPLLRRLAWYLINSLDSDGSLREDEDSLLSLTGASKMELNQVLATIQQLEPVGIGARNLAECLTLQLRGDDEVVRLAREIIDHHLPDLARNQIVIAGVSPEDLTAANQLIRSLNPRPGRQFDNELTRYVLPDFEVEITEDSLTVSLINQPYQPVIPEVYTTYLEETNPEDRVYIRQSLARARAFIKAIEQRENTLHRIADFAVQTQKPYFHSFNPKELNRLTCHDIAEALEVHISTVSRAIKGKHLQCQTHSLPLERLITSGGCGGYSREQLLDKIQALLIASPGLSDQAIANQLNEQGIRIARRTVNKYRNQFLSEGGSDA